MKKLISLLLILTMAVSFAACAKTPAAEEPPAEEPSGTELPAGEEPTEEEAPSETPSAGEEPAEPSPEETETPAEGEEPSETDPAVADLLDKLEQLVDGVEDEMMMTENVEIPADQYPYQLFIDYVEGSHAVTSAAMINTVPHSVCLLELPEDADAAAVAQEIEENLDPRKWICVEAEATAVKTSGQYVLLVMSDQASVDTILSNFETVFSA